MKQHEALARRYGVLLLLLAGPASAQDATDAFFDTRKAEHFGDARLPLREYLRTKLPLKQNHHHFCVIGYQGADKSRRAWVHWREGAQLMLWSGFTDPQYRRDSIRQSRRQLDLKTDVVKTEEEVAGSTYLVTQAWVTKVMGDCEKGGAKYRIKRPKASDG
jgi:hypothetical protein